MIQELQITTTVTLLEELVLCAGTMKLQAFFALVIPT